MDVTRFFRYSVLASGMFSPAVLHAEYFLKDGEKVAFLGDSITASRGYTKIVEHYTLMRFPERRVEFVNAGLGGDTASGSLKRIEAEVFAKHPTVVIVAFGINDIGWGTKADDEHKKLYLDGIRSIISQCQERKIRPVICSAPITAEPSEKAKDGYLQRMCDEGLKLAKSLGAETIDVQRGMREIQKRLEIVNAGEKDPEKHIRLHVKDGIHLETMGDMAMAYSILKGLGAPKEVSSAKIDAAKITQVEAMDCKISDVKAIPDGISFTRLDNGLPLNMGPLGAWTYRWIALADGINGYRLTIGNLPDGEYSIHADGRDLGKTTADALSSGLNIASMAGDGWQPGGPWDAQSSVVKSLVDARDQLWMSGKQQAEYLPGQPDQKTLSEMIQKTDQEIIVLQKKAARPYPYHFEILRAPTEPKQAPK